jgi:preprotein translocase subunit YajC
MANLFIFMADPSGGDAGMLNLVFLGLIFVVFYFFIIRPQNKKQKEIKAKVDQLKKGDKVITSGGLVVIISQIEDDSILSDLGGGKIRVLKTAIVDVNPNKADSSAK